MVLGKRAEALIWQLIKYGFCGGVATLAHSSIFFLCGWYLFPCLPQDDLLVKLLGATAPVAVGSEFVSVLGFSLKRIALYALICSTIGFSLSNFFCWLMDRALVFTPGRHHWAVEFLLFFAVSGISVVFGTILQTALIQQLSISTTIAFGANILTSLCINFVVRKFFIFKG